jgi:hypothetical protein
MTIPEHQIRVIREVEEIEIFLTSLKSAGDKLRDRFDKLDKFINSTPAFYSLTQEEKERLTIQRFHMLECLVALEKLVGNGNHLGGYLDQLKLRILNF